MNKKEKASEYFGSGLNCAQSVLAAFADELGLDKNQIFKLASGLGGGLAKNGHVCGAVNGAIMVLGLKYAGESNNPGEINGPAIAKANQFIAKFKEINGSINCRELLDGVDLLTEEGQAEWTSRNLHDVTCTPVVQKAVEIILDME